MKRQADLSGIRCVCIVRHSFYPGELNVKREAEALLEAGFEVHVICLRRQGEAECEIIDGVHVRRLPVVHRRGHIGRYLFEYNAFFALASVELVGLHWRRRLSAVQINTMPDYLVFSSLFLRLARVKVVLHMHEPMPELFGVLFDRLRHRLLVRAVELAERLSLSYADHVLTVTNEMRENFGRRGADVSKITVILNVPDDHLFSLERYAYLAEQVALVKEEDRRTGTFKLLCHGTIEQRYGFDLIVRAVSRVRNEIPGIQFRFMGQGDDLPAVLAKAEELGVASHVRYLGYLPFEAMIAEILCADVTVVPMRCNPYSALVHTNKMYEYMALRRPIIASRLRSIASYFPEDTILYFDPGDEADLASQVLFAFQNADDLKRRVQRTSELYEVHSWRNVKERYLHVYDTLLRPARREC